MAEIDRYAVRSGNLIAEDGSVKNIVTLLGGGDPVTGKSHDIAKYAPQSGRVLGEDGQVYNLVDLLRNVGAGGGGESQTWSTLPGKPLTFPPSTHNHDERYYTKSDIDNAGYLLAQPDGETVEVQGGELRARTLTGLQHAVTQLNAWLAGTEGNIQGQLNDITMTLAALSTGMRYLGKFESKADLDSVTNKDNGDLAVVLVDETRSNARSMYVYNDSLGMWDFIGAFEFSDAFTALTDTPTNYVDGKVLKSGSSSLFYDDVRWAEILDKPDSTKAQIDDAVAKRHEHSNKSNLDKISEVDGVLTYNGEQYVRASDLPALQTKQRLFAYRSGSDQPLTAGTDCVFNTKHSGDIPYDTSTGIFTLEAGKMYRVEVTGSLYTSGWVVLQLVNAETNSIVNSIARGIWMDVNPSNTNWHESSAGPLKTYITPTATRGYKIRATSTSGEASLRSNYVSLEIVEM